MTERKYTYRPDLPDKRDHYFRPALAAYPRFMDLRSSMTKIEDQGDLGSCTANAAVALAEYLDFRKDRRYRNCSRLFVYYNERVLEGTVGQDSGAYIRDAIKAMAKWGLCTETAWPYAINKFRARPPAACFTAAAKHKALDYQRVNQTLDELCSAIAEGFPVEFGFSVYESFETDAVARTGMVPVPQAGEALLGGHAVAIAGYDLDHGLFICRNSWGRDWGAKGYFYMPVNYVLDGDLAEDFWIVRQFQGIK